MNDNPHPGGGCGCLIWFIAVAFIVGTVMTVFGIG